MPQNSDAILANWNGVEMPLADVRVSVLDRSFLFGDAIYEVLRVYSGIPFRLQDHLDRLTRNLEKLKIPADVGRLAERMDATLQNSGLDEASIYLHVSRGEAPRTHRLPVPAPRPNELIYVQPFRDPYPTQRIHGGRAILIRDIRWKRCDIKSVNLLANVLGAEEAHAAGRDEAIFVEEDGSLVEGTHTSLFAVRDGSILTSPLGPQLLPGITRKLILEMAARTQIPLVEERLHRDQLGEIDELFLTGTSTEVLPIVEVDDISIGDGKPGAITQRLQAVYREIVSAECRPKS
jgi:D-alanine transaminase